MARANWIQENIISLVKFGNSCKNLSSLLEMISESPRKLFCIKITSMPTNPSWGQALQWIFIFSCCETQSLVCSSVSMVTSSSSCHPKRHSGLLAYNLFSCCCGGEMATVWFMGWIFFRGEFFSGVNIFQGRLVFRGGYFSGLTIF